MKDLRSKLQKGGLMRQVIIIFLIGTLTMGLLTFLAQSVFANRSVRVQTEIFARQIADETVRAIREYPASEWLIRYWYEHANELDIEYDVDFVDGNATERKCHYLNERYPDIQLRYATVQEIKSMDAIDQKRYAEITYSWLITRINQIKQVYHISFLFCVVTDEPYDTQFFLFSGADPGGVRGRNYEDVYMLGTISTVGESQQMEMKNALTHDAHLADAGQYVDYYAYYGSFDKHKVLIGLTYDTSTLLKEIKDQTDQGTSIAMIHQVVLALIFMALLFWFVLRPLRTIQQNIRLYSRTKNRSEVIDNLSRVQPPNEIGLLSKDVSSLVKEMDDYTDYVEAISAERQRLASEMDLATRIQEGMLPIEYPAFPDRNEFDVFGTMDPAREVGGDFFDYFLIDEDHLGLIIADVSGKGVPAALFMMACRIILINNASLGKSPAKVLEDTNEAICTHNREEIFITVWLGILEISTGKLTAANAGHEYPTIRKPDGEFELLKDKHGFVIGGMEGMRYTDYEIQLTPGSQIFVYTDGVPEATNADNELFGLERMVKALNKEQDPAPQAVLERVRADVDMFVKEAEQFDDLTMMCLTYLGTDSAG